jgi:hypothetical protein
LRLPPLSDGGLGKQLLRSEHSSRKVVRRIPAPSLDVLFLTRIKPPLERCAYHHACHINAGVNGLYHSPEVSVKELNLAAALLTTYRKNSGRFHTQAPFVFRKSSI